MIILPVIDANDQLLEAELDGITYFIQLSWNSEAAFWTISIENANNDVIVTGIYLAPDSMLLSNYRQLAVPAGEIIALVEDSRQIIGRQDFVDGMARLFYVTAQEVIDAQTGI